jgi:hypothetical protein
MALLRQVLVSGYLSGFETHGIVKITAKGLDFINDPSL